MISLNESVLVMRSNLVGPSQSSGWSVCWSLSVNLSPLVLVGNLVVRFKVAGFVSRLNSARGF